MEETLRQAINLAFGFFQAIHSSLLISWPFPVLCFLQQTAVLTCLVT